MVGGGKSEGWEEGGTDRRKEGSEGARKGGLVGGDENLYSHFFFSSVFIVRTNTRRVSCVKKTYLHAAKNKKLFLVQFGCRVFFFLDFLTHFYIWPRRLVFTPLIAGESGRVILFHYLELVPPQTVSADRQQHRPCPPGGADSASKCRWRPR